MKSIYINKVKLTLISIIIISGTLISLISSKEPKVKNNIEIDLSKPYKVVKVIDGDTFEIKTPNSLLKVRMLGVDTPETVDPRKIVQCFGKEASDKTRELLNNQNVLLETDSTQSKFDKYNRLLAYVRREDGLFINEYLIENGYAHEYTYNIPYKLQKDFKKLEKKARKDKAGLWGSLCLQK